MLYHYNNHSCSHVSPFVANSTIRTKEKAKDDEDDLRELAAWAS